MLPKKLRLGKIVRDTVGIFRFRTDEDPIPYAGPLGQQLPTTDIETINEIKRLADALRMEALL